MKIVTSLSFPGNCREAFEFYARVPEFGLLRPGQHGMPWA
jgi:uncharacterized glyoxalase superfamily protein PhnB